MAATKRTIEAFDRIMSSDMWRLDGEPIDFCAALMELAEAVEAEPEDSDSWLYLGDCGECALCDFIPGTYWALTEWHGGQNSPEYAAMCALGRIFSPGMSGLDRDNSGELAAYEQADAYFRKRYK